jgi:hypothetical protein
LRKSHGEEEAVRKAAATKIEEIAEAINKGILLANKEIETKGCL